MSAVDLSNLFTRCFELADGSEIIFNQSVIGDVGCVVWDAALVLCGYFVKCSACPSPGHSVVTFEGKCVLEVGSGTGVVGLVAACLGARSVVTDLPDFVPLMQHNISVNKDKLRGSCSAKPLVWGKMEQIKALTKSDFPNGADFIILADCVYYEESLQDLVQTILHFSSDHTHVFCSYEDRDSASKRELQRKFVEMMEEHFEVSQVPLSLQDPYYSSPDIHVINFIHKNEYLNL